MLLYQLVLYHLICQVILKYVSYLTSDLTLNVLGRRGHIYWYHDLAAVERLTSQVLGDEAGDVLHGIGPQPQTLRGC